LRLSALTELSLAVASGIRAWRANLNEVWQRFEFAKLSGVSLNKCFWVRRHHE
jgi:hypothetical protein